MVVCFLFTTGIGESFAADKEGNGSKYNITKTEEKNEVSEPFEPSYPEETSSDSTSKQLLILGGAVAVGIAAFAAGGGGGGSSAPACELTPVGPNVVGDDWVGRLRLINHGSQDVVVSVSQCGDAITIVTNTTLPYGQIFNGTISSSGSMLLYDQTTGQDWTTFKGRASSTQLRIYDYVNDATALDSLELSR